MLLNIPMHNPPVSITSSFSVLPKLLLIHHSNFANSLVNWPFCHSFCTRIDYHTIFYFRPYTSIPPTHTLSPFLLTTNYQLHRMDVCFEFWTTGSAFFCERGQSFQIKAKIKSTPIIKLTPTQQNINPPTILSFCSILFIFVYIHNQLKRQTWNFITITDWTIIETRDGDNCNLVNDKSPKKSTFNPDDLSFFLRLLIFNLYYLSEYPELQQQHQLHTLNPQLLLP